MNGIGASGIILLVVLALLLFGPSKLPELGRAVGRTFREFKEGARDLVSDAEPSRKETQTPPQNAPAAVTQDRRLPE